VKQLSTLISILILLIASFSATSAQDTDCDEGFRPFEHFGGVTCVPENPQRIVTTQDQNGLLPLLELGVTPVGSTGLVLDDGTSRFRRINDEYDTSDVTFIGPYWGEANVESMLMLDPDLIVSHEFAEEFYELHSEIAPTVMIQIFERPLTEVLLDFANLVGRTEEGEALYEAYQDRVQTLLDNLGDRADDLTISVITPGNNAGEFYNAAQGQAIGTVMEDLAFNRPLPEQTPDDTRDYFSIESLTNHDADVMLIIDFAGDDGDPIVQEFIASPLFESLQVTQANQVYIIDGTQTVGSSWGKMDNFLAELETILLNPDLDVDLVDEPDDTASGDDSVTASQDTSCDDGFHLFDHEYLATDPVCIPDDPQAIVPLDIISFEFLMINDIQPAVTSALAAQFFTTTQPDWLPQFNAVTADLPDVGFPANPEVVLEFQPDLIIGTAGYYDDAVYDEMSLIAPMIVFDAPIDTVGQDWIPNYEFVGQALGMEETVAEIIAGYEARIDALREDLDDNLDGQTVSVVRAVPPDQLGLRLAGSFSGHVINDLGLQQPESQQPFYDDTTGFIQVNIGRESWQDADGDYLFVYGVQPTEDGTTEAQAFIESLEDDPIWNALNAVQTGQVYGMNGHWHGFGVLAAHDIIDDMYRVFLDAEPTIPNPFLQED